MRPFKNSQHFIGASSTQHDIYSPTRTTQNNRTFNNTVQSSKNKNRAQQIVSLHEQFQDLKKKIKQVQNKNQKIIQKIHRECNFKKKTPQTHDISSQNPIIYYQKKQKSQLSQVSGLSNQQSNKSDQSEYQYKHKKNPSQRKSINHLQNVQSNNLINEALFTQSMEYNRHDQHLTMQKTKSKISNSRYDEQMANSQEIVGIPSYQIDMQSEVNYQPLPMSQTFQHLKDYSRSRNKKPIIPTPYQVSQTSVGFMKSNNNIQSRQKEQQNQYQNQQNNQNLNISIYQLQQNLKIQKEKTIFLEQSLKSKEIEMMNIRKSYKKFVVQNQNLSMVLEDQLQDFMQNVVNKGMIDIERALKKQENKMKILLLNVRDNYQKKKTSRIINQHQMHRSNSRSRKGISQGSQLPSSSTLSKVPHCRRTSQSTSVIPIQTQSSQSNQKKSSKQFQEILNKYQDMINHKNIQINKLENLLKTFYVERQQNAKDIQNKDKHLKDMKLQIEQLQTFMANTNHQASIKQFKIPINNDKSRRRISSTQSNLLQDIYDVNSQQKIKQTQYELKFLQIRKQLQTKNKQLQIKNKQLQTKSQQLQTKSQQLQTKSQQLQAKNQHIIKLQTSLNQLQVKIQKQCQQLQLCQKKPLLQRLQLQRLQQSLRNQLSIKHSTQLTKKDLQIQQTYQKLHQVQRLFVEKECQIVTLNKKVNKYQAQQDANNKKIKEYQKLLNHYQQNVSVDMEGAANLLDQSYCHDFEQLTTQSNRLVNNVNQIINNNNYLLTTQNNQHNQVINTQDNSNNVIIERSQLQNMQNQIQSMNKQILMFTKKVKYLQLAEQDKSIQLNKLNEQIQSIRIQKDRLLRQNSNLNEKVQILQVQLNQISHNDLSKQEEYQLDIQQDNKGQSIEENLGQTAYFLASQKKPTQPVSPMFLSQVQVSSQSFSQIAQSSQSPLLTKLHQLQKILLLTKQQNLQLSCVKISLNKDNSYLQECLSDMQVKYQKVRMEVQQGKRQIQQLNNQIYKREDQLNKERNLNCDKIRQIERQWKQFEEQINTNNQDSKLDHSDILLRSSRFNMSDSSVLLSSTLNTKNTQYLQQQNQYLSIKLKQAQACVQMNNMMQQKILKQYKQNVQRLKNSLKQKCKQTQFLKTEIQVLKDKCHRLQLMNESHRVVPKSKSKPVQATQSLNADYILEEFASFHQEQNNSILSCNEDRMHPFERIIQLQGDLKQAKDINHKLEEMEEQLFKQIKIKQDQKHELNMVIDQKNKKIQQLQQIVQLKQANLLHSSQLGSQLLSSHPSHPKNASFNNPNMSNRQSLHSQSSLRYSILSHSHLPSNQLLSSYLPQQKFQIQLSQTGSQMLDNSYMTNISEIFQKEEFPYEKVQLKRKEQVRLFQKTAAYIKSLKQAILDKNHRIKMLQKKLQSLKSSKNGYNQFQTTYHVSKASHGDVYDKTSIDFQTDSIFKDYQSVQLQRKRPNYNKKFKSIQHEWKLAIQENNVLSNQIQALQQQLQKAEQQQNNLLKIKDLYKDEIKKLLTKNQTQSKNYEQQLLKQKKKLQDSQSVHNIQTLKQLFIKVIDTIIALDQEKQKKKREEKRNDLEQFFRVFASLTSIDDQKRNKLIQGIKKINVTTLSNNKSRSSSEEKHT